MGRRYLYRIIIVILALSICSTMALAGIDSVVIDGSTITITGSDFGTKTNAPPVKWDQFESGSNGTYLEDTQAEWVNYESDNDGAKYSSADKHAGSLAVVNDFTETLQAGFATNYYRLTQAEEVFVTYWYKVANVGSGDGSILKQTRITSSVSAGGGGIYNGTGGTSYGSQAPGSLSLFTIYDNGSTVTDENCCKISFDSWNVWVRIEAYKKLSTAGSSNGVIYTSIIDAGGTTVYSSESEMTRASGETFQLDTVLLGLMDGGHSGSFEVYIDDIYIDTTIARVEIGNTSTWEACTHREIQIPTVWNANGQSITVTSNMGSFDTLDGKYLYVVDSNGAVSDQDTETAGTQGYQIQTGKINGLKLMTGGTLH